MCRRNRSSGRSGWILNGLIMRAAQSIGLHRDGEKFRLSPLECEVRRRLWWQILGSDGRAAEDHGISSGPMGGFDGFCDTKLPTHLDDRDISATTTATPSAQSRWTEMTHFLVATEAYQTLQKFNHISAHSGPDKMDKLEQLLSTAKSQIHSRYLQHCDANIPAQKCALLLGRLLLGKFEVLVRQQELRGLSAEAAAAKARDATLVLACRTIETGIEMKTDELLGSYQWLLATFTDYHLLTYALWHLCVRPATPGAAAAWSAVNRLFLLADTQGWPAPGSKWNVLRKLREKAVAIHQALQVAVPPPATPGVVDAPGLDQGIFDAAGNAPMFADGIVWDIDSICFPDWTGYSSGFAAL